MELKVVFPVAEDGEGFGFGVGLGFGNAVVWFCGGGYYILTAMAELMISLWFGSATD